MKILQPDQRRGTGESHASLNVHEFTLCMMGHSAFQFVYAGFELGLFQLLCENPNLTRKEIAQRLKLAELSSRCLLLGLCGIGFLQKMNESYSNSSFLNALLLDNKSDLLIKFLRFQALIVYPGEFDFVESLRSNSNIGLQRISGFGRDLYRRLENEPALRAVFFDFMSAWSAEAVPMLLNAVDFGCCRRIVDVGGGDGTVALMLARTQPDLEIELLDLPEICDLARKRVAQERMDHRIRVVEGDAFLSEFPRDRDCFIFVHFLEIWSTEEISRLLKKAYDALPEGGRIIVYNSIASDEEDGPVFAGLDSAYFMSVPAHGGLIYSRKDYEQCFNSVGFKNVEYIPCQTWWTPHGVLKAIK